MSRLYFSQTQPYSVYPPVQPFQNLIDIFSSSSVIIADSPIIFFPGLNETVFLDRF
jgi:hypothetical protein